MFMNETIMKNKSRHASLEHRTISQEKTNKDQTENRASNHPSNFRKS